MDRTKGHDEFETSGDSVPQRIGPYEVKGRLGQGGMGEVYLGHDERLDRSVALKRIHPTTRDPARARRRLRREAQAAARLNHPAIVQVYDWVEAEESDWIIMERVEGRSLRHILKESVPPLQDAVRVLLDIAEGLAAAHEAGLIHRDLKPSNVMVTEPGRAKILDFGIARRAAPRSEAKSTTLTEENTIVGTVEAMSPEQALGHPLDHRSDLFSLGILAYQLLTGISPFAGKNRTETLTRICTWRQQPARDLEPAVPKALSSLVDHLLEKEPALRPQSAEEVARRLRQSLRELPGEETTEAPPEAAVETANRNVETIVDGPVLSTPSASAARKLRRPLWAAVMLVVLGLVVGGWYLLDPAMDLGPGTSPAREPTTPYGHFQAGMEALKTYYRVESLDQAEEHFQRALALDAQYAPAYAGLAQAYWRRFRHSRDKAWLDSAMNHANQALQLNPELTFARVAHAQVLLSQGQREGAREEFEAVLKLDPANADAHRGLGDYHRIEGNAEAAETAYEEAIRLRPQSLEFHTLLGALLFAQARYSQAEGSFLKALEIDPQAVDSLSSLAAIYHMQGRYAEAAESLQKALQIRPNYRIYANLGTLYFFQGLYQQALSAYQKAIELGANNYIIWGNLGDAYRWTPGNREKSQEAFQVALQQLDEKLMASPEDVSLRTLKALYLAKKGEGQQALAELSQLKGGKETDAAVLFNATLAAEIAGERDLALDFLGQSLAAGYSIVEVRNEPELAQLREDPRFHQLAISYPASQ